MVADDLDGVLVCTNGTVGTKTPELTSCCACGSRIGVLLEGQRQICYIIVDTDRESGLCCVLEYCYDLSGNCILGAETVTSCEYGDIVELCALESCYYVEVERLAE